MQLSTWKHAKDDDRVRKWSETITEEIDRLAQQDGKAHGRIYINNANEKQDALASYEPECLERMRKVSMAYDKDGVFQKLRRGGPKLWP